MTAVKRPLDEISQPARLELSKTERRRLAKQAKKKRTKESKIGAGGPPGKDGGGKGGSSGDSTNDRGSMKKGKGPKPKMTKEERRAKYTEKAYKARERRSHAGPGAAKSRCLGCRAWGHVVATCPNAKTHTGICFNCGSSEHALRACTKPKQEDGSLPYARCFVCQEKGHISAHCKQNANGIYPKGGSCKGCGSRHHLSKNCPDNPEAKVKNKNNRDADVAASGEDNGDCADTPLASAASHAAGSVPRGQKDESKLSNNVIGASARDKKGAPSMFLGARTGGDDLEDDDYYEPEDVPVFPPEGLEENTAGQQLAKKKTKAKAKIVTF